MKNNKDCRVGQLTSNLGHFVQAPFHHICIIIVTSKFPFAYYSGSLVVPARVLIHQTKKVPGWTWKCSNPSDPTFSPHHQIQRPLFMKGLPSGSCSSAHLAQLAVIILSAMHEAECLRIPNAAAVRSKKEGIYERQRFPSWGRACLAGPHISYTNASQICPPLLIFFSNINYRI